MNRNTLHTAPGVYIIETDSTDLKRRKRGFASNKKELILPTIYATFEAKETDLLAINKTQDIVSLVIDGKEAKFSKAAPYYLPKEGSYSAVITLATSTVTPSMFNDVQIIKTVKFNDEIEIIGSSAFRDCKKLEKLTFNDNLKKIEGWAFHWCYYLHGDLVIPDSVEYIGYAAFMRCNFRSITIGYGNPYIETHSFRECHACQALIIKSGQINYEAFTSIWSLQHIYFGEEVSFSNSSGNRFFDTYDIKTITCYAKEAPLIDNDVFKFNRNTTWDETSKLRFPKGSDYSTWMQTDAYYLGYWGWTAEEFDPEKEPIDKIEIVYK